MASFKEKLAITLPVNIILVLFLLLSGCSSDMCSTVGGLLIVLAILQGIFWKFVKWT